MDRVLVAESLAKRYEDFSLEDVSLDVRPGTISALFGPNGAGKSTLMKVLANHARPDAGALRIFGQCYADHERDLKNRVGYVPQQPAFYAERSVQWTARFVAPYFACWDGARCYRLLDEFRINPLKKIRQLPAGQIRLLSLALALSHGAELLVLDEPTAGLDVVFRRALLDRLRAFVADGARAVIVASHVTDGLGDLADEVSFLHAGRIVMHDDRDELLSRWKWVHFRDGAIHRAVEDRLLGVRRQPFGSCGLTGEFPTLREDLADALDAGDARIENARLEDVLIHLVKGA